MVLPRSTPSRLTTPLLPLVLAGMLALFPTRSAAQGSPADGAAADADGWNAPRALELVGQARDVRRRASVDPELRAYAADATGHVFFLIDRPDSDERTLVKADQIALEVYWRAPGQTRQRIVGLRDREVLPTNVQYHLDHLTVVQDDFDDRIRLGDGDEVEAVTHPVAPGSERVYDFRLGDSLTISFSGAREDVRVYEVQVRPRDPDLPGFVGSIFLDRSNAAIVRMTFTFTPASYVDPYLDYIRISLDNSLWEGRWWLPYRQEAEIRRELPQLDFLAGSVIRGRFEIGEYRFNPELPDALFRGATVTTVPLAEREAFPFEEPLIPEETADALAPTPSLREVRERARALVAGRYLSGLAALRLHVPAASDVVRWNRVEGAFLGMGFVWRPSERAAVRTHGGWSFGRERPELELSVTGGPLHPTSGVRATWNVPRDLGPFPGSTGTLNTLTALLADEDWLDLWFASGIEAFHGAPLGGASTRLAVRWERQRSGRLAVDPGDAGDLRPVRRIDDGDLIGARLGVVAARGALETELDIGASRLDPVAAAAGASVSGSLGAAVRWERVQAAGGVRLAASLDGGLLAGDPPRQQLYLLGGRETLPGHPYRAFVGDRFWLARAEASRALARPWVTLRAFASAGEARLGAPHPVETEWGVRGDAGVRASAGAGLGLAWDVVHVDLGRGLDGGEWELVVSVDRRFRGWL